LTGTHTFSYEQEKNKFGEANMIKSLSTLVLIVALTGCGTTGGILNGTGVVLEGIATDLQGAAGVLDF